MSTPGAQITRCNACDFEFCSNHSYSGIDGHSAKLGLIEAMCVACLKHYVLPTVSPWGAGQAEILELHTQERLFRSRADRRANRGYYKLTGLGVEALFDLHWYDSGVIPDVNCPACEAQNAVVVDFIDGMACPACQGGVLQCRPVLL